MTSFEKTVKEYLDQLAKKDSIFAKTYAKANKSIEECCKFIVNEVSKKRKNESYVAVPDEEVYGLALHYYDEDDIKVNGKVAAKVEVAANGEEKPKAEPKTKKVTLKRKKVEKPAEDEADGAEIEELTFDCPLF